VAAPHPRRLEVEVRVEGELVDHLGVVPSQGRVRVRLELPAGLRDVVQSLGIPHVECGEVAVNTMPAGWDRVVHHGDRITLQARYPLASQEPDPRFLLDDHLGKLARHLRLLGFDTAHRRGADDAALAARSAAVDAALLTRDRGLLMRAGVHRGRLIRHADPLDQAREVVASFRLGEAAAPFTRCLACNGLLERADPGDVGSQVPPGVLARHQTFLRCTACERVYWEGTHVARLRKIVTAILGPGAGPTSRRPRH
jgi:uncharacterized protein with PIN domain